MKKSLAFIACLLLSFCLILSGCSGLEMPASNAKVYGNGGSVVQKGEYIYFANAYTNYSALSDKVSNKEGEAGLYSLYRIKTTDVNGSLNLDNQGFVKNAEVIVEKVVGFEYSNLYIVGDNLYFGSPNMHKNSNNENKFNLVSIFKVKLDGSGLKELYTTEEYTSSSGWAVYNIGGVNYLVTFEGSKIVRHTINKKGKLDDKTVLASGVTGGVLPESNGYANDNKIFFTSNRPEGETELGLTGNVLKSVEIATGTVKQHRNLGDTVKIVNYKFGNLIYTLKDTVDDSYVWADDFNGNQQRLTYWQVENPYVACVMGNGLKLVYSFEDKLVVQNFGSNEVEVLVDGDATVINVTEDYVYYTLDSKIARVSLIDKQITQIYEDKEMEDIFDFDSRYIFYFTKTKNNSSNTLYMHCLDLHALEQNTEVVAQPLGEIAQEDKVEKSAE